MITTSTQDLLHGAAIACTQSPLWTIPKHAHNSFAACTCTVSLMPTADAGHCALSTAPLHNPQCPVHGMDAHTTVPGILSLAGSVNGDSPAGSAKPSKDPGSGRRSRSSQATGPQGSSPQDDGTSNATRPAKRARGESERANGSAGKGPEAPEGTVKKQGKQKKAATKEDGGAVEAEDGDKEEAKGEEGKKKKKRKSGSRRRKDKRRKDRKRLHSILFAHETTGDTGYAHSDAITWHHVWYTGVAWTPTRARWQRALSTKPSYPPCAPRHRPASHRRRFAASRCCRPSRAQGPPCSPRCRPPAGPWLPSPRRRSACCSSYSVAVCTRTCSGWSW